MVIGTRGYSTVEIVGSLVFKPLIKAYGKISLFVYYNNGNVHLFPKSVCTSITYREL